MQTVGCRERSPTKGKRPRTGPDSKFCSVCQILAKCVHPDIRIATAMPPERTTCFNTCRQVEAHVGHENQCASEGRRRNTTESQKQPLCRKSEQPRISRGSTITSTATTCTTQVCMTARESDLWACGESGLFSGRDDPSRHDSMASASAREKSWDRQVDQSCLCRNNRLKCRRNDIDEGEVKRLPRQHVMRDASTPTTAPRKRH